MGKRASEAQIGRAVRVAAAGAMATAWVLLPASPVLASSLDGCSGTAESLNSKGTVIDSAAASGGKVEDTFEGGEGFTAKNPFEIENDGTVNYAGSTDAVITNHEWTVSLLGIEVLSGGSANAEGEQSDEGSIDLEDELPFAITGLVRVEGELVGDGGSCTGDGYVKVGGNPLASPITWAGAAAAGAGAAGLVAAVPKVRRAKGA